MVNLNFNKSATRLGCRKILRTTRVADDLSLLLKSRLGSNLAVLSDEPPKEYLHLGLHGFVIQLSHGLFCKISQTVHQEYCSPAFQVKLQWGNCEWIFAVLCVKEASFIHSKWPHSLIWVSQFWRGHRCLKKPTLWS